MEETRRWKWLRRWSILIPRSPWIFFWIKTSSKLDWRLFRGLTFFTGSHQALVRQPSRIVPETVDINNVFCQTHEANLQVLSPSTAGMCLPLPVGSKKPVLKWQSCDAFWITNFDLERIFCDLGTLSKIEASGQKWCSKPSITPR